MTVLRRWLGCDRPADVSLQQSNPKSRGRWLNVPSIDIFHVTRKTLRNVVGGYTIGKDEEEIRGGENKEKEGGDESTAKISEC